MICVRVFISILIGALVADPVHAAWPPEGLEVNGDTQVLRVGLTGDGSGGVLAISRTNSQTYFRTRCTRVSGSGGILWHSPFSPGDYAWDSYMQPDGLGGVFANYWYPYDTTWTLEHVTPSGALDPTWPTTGLAIARWYSTYGYNCPWVQNDGTGGALTFFRPRGTSNTPGSGLWARRVLANGSFDPGWPAAGLRIGTTPSDAYGSSVRGLSDGAGGGIVIWTTSFGDVRAQRVTAAGAIAPGWPANGLVLSDASFTGAAPVALVPSGSDHYFAAWTDTEAPPGVVVSTWLQRFHRDGTLAVGWPAGARLVFTDSQSGSEVESARMIGDGSTGVYLAGNGTSGLVATRILADGSTASGWAGVALGVGVSFDIAGGANSGLFAAWVGFQQQVITRWLLADGSPDHRPGIRVVTPPGADARRVAALSDGYGGAYVTWEDFANWPPDRVMLQWVPYDPSLVGVTPTPPARAIALQAWPNPARDALEVEFALVSSSSRARLDLLDVAGRRVRSVEAQGAGSHVVKIEALEDIAPGVYLLRLVEDDRVRTLRVALTH